MRLLLSIVNILLALTLLAWPIGLFVLLFLFDAPGSEANTLALAAAWSILLYPVPIVVGVIGYWRNRAETSLKKPLRYTLLALCGPAFVVLALAALELVCGGSLACT